MHKQIPNQGVKQHNIESWCQKVLDLLDLSFPESLGFYLNYQIYLDFLITWNSNLDNRFFLSHKEGK